MLSTAHLDALPWTHTAGPFRALAHDFVVHTCDRALGEYLGAVLDPFAIGESAGEATVTTSTASRNSARSRNARPPSGTATAAARSGCGSNTAESIQLLFASV